MSTSNQIINKLYIPSVFGFKARKLTLKVYLVSSVLKADMIQDIVKCNEKVYNHGQNPKC